MGLIIVTYSFIHLQVPGTVPGSWYPIVNNQVKTIALAKFTFSDIAAKALKLA